MDTIDTRSPITYSRGQGRGARLRGEREVTSQADTVIEIDAMNTYIHDGTVVRACSLLQATSYDEGFMFGGGMGEGVSTLHDPLHRGWICQLQFTLIAL